MVRPLSPTLQEKATKELNEEPNRIGEDLNFIRNWLKQQPHIKARTDDQWLVSFLRGCKFSLQKTKEKLDCFYTVRSLVPELYAGRDPLLPQLQLIINAGVVLPLPKTVDASGPRIVLVRYSQCDPETMTFANVLKVYFMLCDIMLREDDNFVISGVYVFMDFKDFPLTYLSQHTPSLAKKVFFSAQSAYPPRFKGVCFINPPSAFEVVYSMLRTVLNNKLKSRLNLVNEQDMDKLYDIIPKDCVPYPYGTYNEDIDNLTEEWKKKLESNREWFLEDDNYHSIEELRPEASKMSADFFGVEGSFRKLSID